MDFAQRAIDLARQNVAEGGRPFATVIAKDGHILAESANKVAQTHDPTAHAEFLAIRQACQKLGTEHLTGSTIYVLAQPCPMCLGSLYYCSPDAVVFLTTRPIAEGQSSSTKSCHVAPPFLLLLTLIRIQHGCRIQCTLITARTALDKVILAQGDIYLCQHPNKI